jgi:hypothetical protein
MAPNFGISTAFRQFAPARQHLVNHGSQRGVNHAAHRRPGTMF